MSGIDDQGMRPPGVERTPSDEPEAEAVNGQETEPVPAGHAGADSGSADTVHVDSEDESEVPDSSAMNDAPGVGPRPPEE